jgi:hypothetical protein
MHTHRTEQNETDKIIIEIHVGSKIRRWIYLILVLVLSSIFGTNAVGERDLREHRTSRGSERRLDHHHPVAPQSPHKRGHHWKVDVHGSVYVSDE